MYKVGFVGNPNVGKTSLYNLVTKSNLRVGNWHGVTVDCTQKVVKTKTSQIAYCDLPGIYSLQGFGVDEQNALTQMEQGFDLLVCVVDCTQLQKNLYLLL
ncbi:MAG: 50S ribosome-binding GTPase, partial [Firmicutes bacterium]|nr:50S ribosome-binding GTPase [Bacillota bacterium]